jgi:predicted nucleic acid-binding protein
MILLDTNTVVVHFNGVAAVSEKIASRIEEIGLPALVVAELDYGAKASARAAENVARLSAFLQGVEVVPFDESAARDSRHVRCGSGCRRPRGPSSSAAY